MVELTKEARVTVEIQHLALELYDLTRTQGPGVDLSHDERARQVRELADTLGTKMLAVGPLRNERGAYFRAVRGRVFEHVEQNPPQRCYRDLSDHAPWVAGGYGWFYALSTATPCSVEEYAAVAEQADDALIATWPELSPEERAAYDLARSQPLVECAVDYNLQAASTARHTAVLWVGAWMVEAFRKAAAEWGATIAGQEPAVFNGVGDGFHYTVLLQDTNDLFQLGKLMVLEYHASKGMGGPNA